MIAGFQEWAASQQLIQTFPLSTLEGRGLAIDAEDYIEKVLTGSASKEPLLPALGGIPFVIESLIDDHIKLLREHKIKPVFVFSGLGADSQHQRLASSLQHSKNVSEAWDLYNASDPERAVAEFGNSCIMHTHSYRAFGCLADIGSRYIRCRTHLSIRSELFSPA